MTSIATNPHLISNPPWDQSQDFELIAQTLRDGNILEQMPMKEHLTANFKNVLIELLVVLKLGSLKQQINLHLLKLKLL